MPPVSPDSLVSAYVRARDADPKSAYGDAIAVCGTVDGELAEFVAHTASDALMAPAFEPEALEILQRKRKGRFLVVQVDPDFEPPRWETREVFGVSLRQERDTAPITRSLLVGRGLPDGVVTDALLAMVTLRYTQSNSVAFTRDGVVLGVGAGQQNRVDCIRLAGTKARTWWLRRHPYVRELPAAEAMSRPDRLNWQIRFADQTMTHPQEDEFLRLFGTKQQSTYRDPLWRPDWTTGLRGLTLASDGFLPFRDNIDVASEFGTQVVIEPGGSIRTTEVTAAAQELGITHITTGLRLFHH